MLRFINLMLFFLVIVLSNSCKSSKKVFYSYTSKNYDVGGGKKEDLKITSRLISYDECLFEFKIRENTNDTVFMESNKIVRSVYDDTTGLYILPYKTNQYFEFDTFAVKNTLVKTGNITEKELGQKFSSYVNTPLVFYKNKTPKDTLIYGRHYFYVDSLLKNRDGIDSIRSKILLFKNRHFISNYKIGLTHFRDKEYCPVGYHVFYYENKIELLGIIEEMRPLTEEENKICSIMLKKALGSNAEATKK